MLLLTAVLGVEQIDSDASETALGVEATGDLDFGGVLTGERDLIDVGDLTIFVGGGLLAAATGVTGAIFSDVVRDLVLMMRLSIFGHSSKSVTTTSFSGLGASTGDVST